MPAVGSLTDQTRTFGDFPMVPEKYQAAMQFGIPFFELRLRGKSDNDRLLFGPFDVRVKSYFDPVRNKERYTDRWLTDNQAHIRYEVNDRGTGVAFMPDDHFWHNRLMLMDNPGLLVMQYHKKDGIYPGAIVNMQIDCLRQRLKTEVTIWRVMEDERERDFFYTKDDAQAFINEFEQAVPTLDKATGQIRNANRKRRNFKIVEGKKLNYKPEISALIKKERGHKFGWSECLYFKDQIKPDVEAAIEERNKKFSINAQDDSTRRGSILSDILNLTTEEKQKLKEDLGMSSTAAPSGEQDLPPVPLPGDDNKEFIWEKRTKGALNRMTLPQLKTILKGRGFGVDGLAKPMIVHKILETDQGSPEPKTQEIIT